MKSEEKPKSKFRNYKKKINVNEVSDSMSMINSDDDDDSKEDEEKQKNEASTDDDLNEIVFNVISKIEKQKQKYRESQRTKSSSVKDTGKESKPEEAKEKD